jgi:hypothetical protein
MAKPKLSHLGHIRENRRMFMAVISFCQLSLRPSIYGVRSLCDIDPDQATDAVSSDRPLGRGA